MLLKEWLETNNIWGEVQTLGNFGFVYDVNEMNQILSLRYGERTLFPAFETVPLTIIANEIYNVYGRIWDAQYQLIITKGVKGLGNETTETVGNVQGTKETVNDSTNTNQISSFNSPNLIDDTANLNNGTVDETTVNDNTSTVDKYNTQRAYNDLTTIEKYLIINRVQKAIAESLTLNIY